MSPDNLPTYIPLNQAATRYSVNVAMLHRAVESGIMRAVKVNKEVMVADEDIGLLLRRNKVWSKVAHLENNSIGVHEASVKYKVPLTSMYHWIQQGYIRVMDDTRKGGRGRKRLLNEADVAYASLLSEHKRGRRVFSPEVLPPHVSASVL